MGTETSPGDETGAEVAIIACDGGRRNRSNFWLDVATALVFCAMAGSGVLLEFVLVHRGGGTWLGWSRHDWGEVHFWLGLALLGLVVVHLVQHRLWIGRCWRRFAGSARSPLSWALLAVGLLLMVAPLLIPAQPGRGGRPHRGEAAQSAPGAAEGWRGGRGVRGGRGSRGRAPRQGVYGW